MKGARELWNKTNKTSFCEIKLLCIAEGPWTVSKSFFRCRQWRNVVAIWKPSKLMALTGLCPLHLILYQIKEDLKKLKQLGPRIGAKLLVTTSKINWKHIFYREIFSFLLFVCVEMPIKHACCWGCCCNIHSGGGLRRTHTHAHTFQIFSGKIFVYCVCFQKFVAASEKRKYVDIIVCLLLTRKKRRNFSNFKHR